MYVFIFVLKYLLFFSLLLFPPDDAILCSAWWYWVSFPVSFEVLKVFRMFSGKLVELNMLFKKVVFVKKSLLGVCLCNMPRYQCTFCGEIKHDNDNKKCSDNVFTTTTTNHVLPTCCQCYNTDNTKHGRKRIKPLPRKFPR